MIEKTIDIIIPAWKAQKTLPRLLSSIASQTIVDLCKITIVNDCDNIGYDEIINLFKPLMDIRVLNLNKNGGPGVARQHGLDNTNLPYIVFADADDSFYSSFALQTLYENICKHPSTVAILGEHLLEVPKPELKFIHYKSNYVWVFGKIFRRSVLDKYNIRFNESRINEDVSFNILLKLCTKWNQEEKAVMLPNVVYVWHSNSNSITRSDPEFTLGDNIVGYMENITYTLKKAISMRLNNKHFIQKDIIANMVRAYVYTEQSLAKTDKFFSTNLKACKDYYVELYEILEQTLDSQFLYQEAVKEFESLKETLTQFIPKHSFYEFIDLLKEN